MKTTNPLNKAKLEEQEPVSHIASEALQIDEKGMQHVMNLLANIYQNSALAVFREYLANGSDAMREAGTLGKTPMLVTLSGPDQGLFRRYFDNHAIPGKGVFSIRDFGTGMDKESLLKVYSRYGASTKTGDNDSIGGFGIGAKSALAITDYFEISSFINGTRLDGYIKTGKDKTATLYITSETKTNEENGLEVRIPIDKGTHERIVIESEQFFYAWSENAILVNGAVPRFLGELDNQEKYLALKDTAGNTVGWYQINTRKNLETQVLLNSYEAERLLQINTPTIFIGNIPYSISDIGSFKHLKITMQKLNRSGIKVRINAPIGSLTLSPDRESIQDNDDNIRILGILLEQVVKLVPTTLIAYMQSLDLEKAYKLYAHNAFSFFSDDPEKELSKTYSDHYAAIRDKHNIFTTVNTNVQYRDKILPRFFNFSEHYPEETAYSLHRSGDKTIAYTVNKSTKIDLLGWAVSTFDTSEHTYQPTLEMRRALGSYNAKRFAGTLFLYGNYTGRSKDPVMRYAKPVIKALANNDKYTHYRIIHVESDVAPPVEVSAVTKVMEINDFETYAKSLRKAPVSTNRAETVYPLITFDPQTNRHFVNHVPKVTISQISNLIILEPTLFTKIVRGYDWREELKKTYNRDVLTTDFSTGAGIFQYFEGYSFTVIPTGRTADAFLKINPTARTLTEVWQESYAQWTKKEKDKLFLYQTLLKVPVLKKTLDLYKKNDTKPEIKNNLLKNFFEDMSKLEDKASKAIHVFDATNFAWNYPLRMFYPFHKDNLIKNKIITTVKQEEMFERIMSFEHSITGLNPHNWERGQVVEKALETNLSILTVLFEGYPELKV